MKVLFALVSVVSLWSNVGFSQAGSSSLGTHTHGVSQLMVAIVGDQIDIRFESPAMNLLGFEHVATSMADKSAVSAAIATLKNHGALFTFDKGQCTTVHFAIDTASVLPTKASSHDHHHGHDDDSHNEITAEYQFSCNTTANLSSIRVGLFQAFPGIQQIQAKWLYEAAQGAISLTPGNTIMGVK